MLEELYLSTLSRFPTAEDAKVALEYVAKSKDERKAWEDVFWTMLRSKEFIYRH